MYVREIKEVTNMKNTVNCITCGNLSKQYHVEEALVHHLKTRAQKAKDIGPIVHGVDIGAERKNCGFESMDLSENITVRDFVLNGMQTRMYKPDRVVGKLPCIIYIHGGGFVAGDLAMVENPCKRLSQLSNSIVLSIAYDLSPEHAYPHATNQCYGALTLLYEEAEKYGIDARYIALCADSAGANIALSCAQKDRELQRILRYLMLYYPVVDMRNEYVNEWKRSAYGGVDNEYVNYCIHSLEGCIQRFQNLYLQGHSAYDPYVSPICLKDFSDLPPILMMIAEYDYLRLQEEAFFLKAKESCSIEMLMYTGVNHGFLEKLGVFPQADHSLQYAAKRWLSFIKKEEHF